MPCPKAFIYSNRMEFLAFQHSLGTRVDEIQRTSFTSMQFFWLQPTEQPMEMTLYGSIIVEISKQEFLPRRRGKRALWVSCVSLGFHIHALECHWRMEKSCFCGKSWGGGLNRSQSKQERTPHLHQFKNSFISFQRGGVISTGNPCPICRDEYLVLDFKVRLCSLIYCINMFTHIGHLQVK